MGSENNDTLGWADANTIRSRVAAGLPKCWLFRFVTRHPSEIRKLGKARNASVLYRVSAVLGAIEAGEV